MMSLLFRAKIIKLGVFKEGLLKLESQRNFILKKNNYLNMPP